MATLDNKTLWDQALTDIELNVSRANFGTWFRNTYITKQDDGVIHISTPNTFVKDWLISKFHKMILKSLRTIAPEVRGVEYVITKTTEQNRVRQETFQRDVFNRQLGINELYINKDDNLNPKYTFETFIVGPFNETAYAAAQGVTKNPGTNYNPLFIYGGTGLGKTHLIQAVGNHLKKELGKRVHYVTSERFAMDYINSLQENKANIFKEKYRKYDAIIMDDVQFFSDKIKTQEELFHLFNSFYENNKQIVFSSDKPPKFIPNLEERLRSRFEGGMIIEVTKPEYESRLAILRSKLTTSDFLPEPEVVEYLASMVQDSIRELEGALNTIICQCQVKQRNLNLNEVKNLIKNSIKPQKTVSIKDVMKIVSDFYSIEEKSLYEKTRRKEVVRPRQIIMYILREDFNTSYPYIGQKLGGRDHTTVIHAYDKIKGDMKTNTILQQEIEQIRGLLYQNS